MELGLKGLDMFQKQKDHQSPMEQLKNAFGAGNKSGEISRKKQISGRISLKEFLKIV
jgi:hypothetical protein